MEQDSLYTVLSHRYRLGETGCRFARVTIVAELTSHFPGQEEFQRASIGVCLCMRACVRETSARTDRQTDRQTHTHTHTHTHTDTHTDTYTDTQTHTQAHTQTQT